MPENTLFCPNVDCLKGKTKNICSLKVFMKISYNFLYGNIFLFSSIRRDN